MLRFRPKILHDRIGKDTRTGEYILRQVEGFFFLLRANNIKDRLHR